jgi:glutamate racemase
MTDGPRATGDDRPIGVFDSGFGGLTVVRALIDLLPAEDLLFFGDNGRFPYGPKPPEEVRRYAVEITDLLVERDVKMVVVACNTASAAALELLRERHDVPIVGVVEPGLRAAAKVTATGRVGVIGTVGTIASGAYQRAAAATVRPGGVGIELTCAACPGFVEFVEAGEVDSDQVYVLAERLLDPVRRAGVDSLVLGCTHYPLLARVIGDVMGRDVVLVSSADETAFEVKAVLGEAGGTAPVGRVGKRAFVTSGSPDVFRTLGVRFCGPEVHDVEPWTWSSAPSRRRRSREESQP